MRRLGQIAFIILNVIVSLVVVLAVITLNDSQRPAEQS